MRPIRAKKSFSEYRVRRPRLMDLAGGSFASRRVTFPVRIFLYISGFVFLSCWTFRSLLSGILDSVATALRVSVLTVGGTAAVSAGFAESGWTGKALAARALAAASTLATFDLCSR